MRAYTHGSWAHQHRVSTICLTRKKLSNCSCAPDGIWTAVHWIWSPTLYHLNHSVTPWLYICTMPHTACLFIAPPPAQGHLMAYHRRQLTWPAKWKHNYCSEMLSIILKYVFLWTVSVNALEAAMLLASPLFKGALFTFRDFEVFYTENITVAFKSLSVNMFLTSRLRWQIIWDWVQICANFDHES